MSGKMLFPKIEINEKRSKSKRHLQQKQVQIEMIEFELLARASQKNFR